MTRMLLVVAVIAACSDAEPPLSTATSLACPTPGALPFRLQVNGFQSVANRQLATDDPRIKDEASDTLGNPGGVMASIYLPDDRAVSTAPIDYRGAKARTTSNSGLTAMPFVGEPVSLWYYDPDAMAWQSLGRIGTGGDGYYDVQSSGFVAPNGRPVYAVLEADHSCAEHFDLRLAPGAKVVVTDIDGTLTTSDSEFLMQLGDLAHVPAMMAAADRLLQAWATKGYSIVYLTARPHVTRAETRAWLEALGFPSGPVITATAFMADPTAYKSAWMKRLVDDFHWNVVAAYGNADTDIAAYASASVPPTQTFIIGVSGGHGGTVAIENNDYSLHIATYVAAQPANN